MPPKGKPATKGAKQIIEDNKSTLQFYIYIIFGANAFYFGLTFFFFLNSFTAWYMFLSSVTTATYIGGYKFLKYMGTPTYNAEGGLINTGTDLNMHDGLGEHVKDMVLLTAIVQTSSLISNYFWVFLLLAPARAFYMLWVNILGPWFFAPPPEVDEKKQKKMERKMKRR